MITINVSQSVDIVGVLQAVRLKFKSLSDSQWDELIRHISVNDSNELKEQICKLDDFVRMLYYKSCSKNIPSLNK